MSAQSGETVAMTVTVDRIRCDGSGLCADLLPEMIARDDWGYPIVDPRPVPPHLMAHARRAVASCPLLALRLTADNRRPSAAATNAGRTSTYPG
jgi:ferredoxin